MVFTMQKYKIFMKLMIVSHIFCIFASKLTFYQINYSL